MEKDIKHILTINKEIKIKLKKTVDEKSIAQLQNSAGYIIDNEGFVFHLSLANLGLGFVPKSITKLKRLRSLELYRNNLEKLPDFITELVNIETLSIRDNKLSEFPYKVLKLEKLNLVNLDYNKIKILPKEIWDSKFVIEWEWFLTRKEKINSIAIQANPIESPPIHIINQGKIAVLNYFDELNPQLLK